MPVASVAFVTEQRVWRGVDGDLFQFTTTERRELNVAVMAAFDRAATLDPALNLDRVRAALADVGWDLPVEADVLQRTLEALVEWGLLDVTQDHAAQYATPEEFERKNLQWSLTHRGEAAIAGVLHSVDVLRHAVGLQPAVLDAIGDTLADLAALIDAPRGASPDGSRTDARIHVLLAQVESHLSSLIASVRQFNGHLQRLLREDAVDDQIFSDVKRRTISYLEEYVTGVERPQRRLRLAVQRLDGLGVATMLDLALSGANLAPVDGRDPGPAWIAERRRRWASLQAWFCPADAADARIEGLLGIARTAIVELLRVLERRWDRRRRSASVAQDFRLLADWFADAPGDDEAHALFGAAFGIWPARHAHLTPPDGEEVVTSQSWLTGPAVDVAPALRTTGTLVNRGRVQPVRDPAHTRAARLREQTAALAGHRTLRTTLSTAGAVRLSSFGQLDPAVFTELLDLLSTALCAPLDGSGSTRRALSIDGQVEVSLTDAHDGGTALLHTVAGVLSGPDLWVSIDLIDSRRAQPEPEDEHWLAAAHA